MFSKSDMKWVRLLERGNRKITTSCVKTGKRKAYGVYLWKEEYILNLGFSTDSLSDALMRCVRERIKDAPVCELATEFYRWRQLANLEEAKRLLGYSE